jgi:hypothetical protein
MPYPDIESIRRRYQYACGYCGVTEVDVGGELTIDHHRPRSAGGDDDEANLVYACARCNQYKGGFWPDPDCIARRQRVLHPLLDDLAVHLVEDEQTGRMKALSETGRFHIALLRLNRPQLVAHRLARKLQSVLGEKQRLLEQQNADLKKTMEAQEDYIALLESLLEK